MDIIRDSQWIDHYEHTQKVVSPHEQVSSLSTFRKQLEASLQKELQTPSLPRSML